MLASFNAQFAHPSGWLGHVAGWPILSPTTGDKIVALKNRARNAWAMELLEVRPADHILELGFGPGWAIQQLVPLPSIQPNSGQTYPRASVNSGKC
jgi:hypothetical protein